MARRQGDAPEELDGDAPLRAQRQRRGGCDQRPGRIVGTARKNKAWPGGGAQIEYRTLATRWAGRDAQGATIEIGRASDTSLCGDRDDECEPADVNKSGEAVGVVQGRGAFYTSQALGDSGRLLTGPEGRRSSPPARSPTVARSSVRHGATGDEQATIWPADGAPSYVVPASLGRSTAHDVTEGGTIVGNLGAPRRAFVATIPRDGQPPAVQQLDPPAEAGCCSSANAANEHGWIVGWAGGGYPEQRRAVLWHRGKAIDLNDSSRTPTGGH